MTIRLDLRPEEISNIIKNQIKNYDNKTEAAETRDDKKRAAAT